MKKMKRTTLLAMTLMAAIGQAARIAAKEATAQGINWVYSPMVDISVDPVGGVWPRVQAKTPCWLAVTHRDDFESQVKLIGM